MNMIDALIFVARITQGENAYTVKEAIDCQCKRRNASSVDRFILEHMWTRREYPPEWNLNVFKRDQINLM